MSQLCWQQRSSDICLRRSRAKKELAYGCEVDVIWCLCYHLKSIRKTLSPSVSSVLALFLPLQSDPLLICPQVLALPLPHSPIGPACACLPAWLCWICLDQVLLFYPCQPPDLWMCLSQQRQLWRCPLNSMSTHWCERLYCRNWPMSISKATQTLSCCYNGCYNSRVDAQPTNTSTLPMSGAKNDPQFKSICFCNIPVCCPSKSL